MLTFILLGVLTPPAEAEPAPHRKPLPTGVQVREDGPTDRPKARNAAWDAISHPKLFALKKLNRVGRQMLAEERLKAKGLKLTHGELYGGGYGYRSTLSSEWKGRGKDLAYLRYLDEPVEFFGGFFGTTDGEGVRALCQVPQLRKLFIGSGEFGDADLANLGQLKELKSLSINFLPITDQGLEGLTHLTQLEELYLRELKVTDKTLLRLGGPGRARLERLILSGLDITDKSLSILEGKPAPEEIDLSGTKVTDRGLSRLDFRTHKWLWVNLAKTEVSGGWLKALPAEKMEISLLDLSDTPLADDSLAYLKDKEVKTLNLSGTPVTKSGLAHLKAVRWCSNLDLSRTKLTNDDLAVLSDVPNLGALKLGDTLLTGSGLKHLGQVERLNGLELSRTKADDQGLKELKNCTQLEKLGLAETLVSGSTLSELTGLPLTLLDLSQTKTGNESLKAIGQFSKLRNLKLKGTAVTAPGLHHLAGLERLVTLELDDTHIKGEGLKDLSKLGKLMSLTLNGTNVTDRDLVHLDRIGDDFIEIQLCRTAVTPKGIRSLFKRVAKQKKSLWVDVTKSAAFEELKKELKAEDYEGGLTLRDPEPRTSAQDELLQKSLRKMLQPLFNP